MKKYEGKIGMVGAGTRHTNGFGFGMTRRTIVEIGPHTLKNLVISDQLENYIQPGTQARIGVIAKHVVVLELNGNKYKHGFYNVVVNRLLTTAYLIPIGIVAFFVLTFNTKNAYEIMLYVAIGILSFLVYSIVKDAFAVFRF